MIADLKPYAEYKESGLPWLGQVPGHWSVVRIKTVLREADLRSQEGTGTLLSLTRVRGLIPHRDMTDKVHSAKTLVGYKRYRAGQLVMNRMQAWSGMFGAGKLDGLVSPDYAVFEVLGGHAIKLILERLKTYDLVGQFALESKGIGSGFNRLYTDRFGPIAISLPPPDEQAAIVRFLDWANGRLERAIRAKRKVIALLNEQKQAIIHRAVTRGLDPSAPLKASGIPWLGDIPAHWEVKRLGSLLRERGEGNDHGEISHVLSLLRGRGVIPYDEKGNIGNKKSDDITRYKIVRPDDIVMNCMNVIIGSVGISRYTGCLSPVYYVLVRRNESDSPSYLNAIFQCSTFHRSLVRIGNGILAHRMRIPMELLKCELLPYPPCAEQAQIIEGLRSATEEFDNAIDRTEREMDLLREYRTRLVSDVVTGKLDVREAAARLPDEEPLPDGAASDDEPDATSDELLVDEETLV